MSKKKKPKPNDKEQSARFIETAERSEMVEKPEEAFEKTLASIAKSKWSDKKPK